MKRLTAFVAAGLLAGSFAFVGVGCESDQNGEEPTPEHPTGGEHPGDHPDHPGGDHPSGGEHPSR